MTLLQQLKPTEIFSLSSSPLATDNKNSLLMDQRAELLSNIRGLDGRTFVILKLPETNTI